MQDHFHADIGDGTEEMDLNAGTFTDPFDLGVGEEGSNGCFNDEVPGEFDAPGVPDDNLLLMAGRRRRR
jgi:hypothetical protein